MKMHIDAAFKSINKFKEELCGDKVQILRTENSTIAVLADGLGSGVKANILSTLTSTIIATMLQGGRERGGGRGDQSPPRCPCAACASWRIPPSALPRCSTTGRVDLVEFDNPPCIFIRDGEVMDLEEYSELKECAGKNVTESHFTHAPPATCSHS